MRFRFYLAVCLSAFVASTSQAQTKNTPPVTIDYHQPGTPLPALRVITLDTLPSLATKPHRHIKHSRRRHHEEAPDTALVYTKIITDKNVPAKGNLFLMIFNPTCGHCEDQTDQFIKNISLFNKSNLVLVTNPVMRGYLPDFIKNHHIKDHPQIQVGVDSSGYISNTFLYGSLPQINIYNSDLKLIKMYQGEVVIDSLKQYIQ